MLRVAVFARPPVAGAVKTRLSPALPAVPACALYRGMLRDALATVAGTSADERTLWWSDAPAAEVAAEVPPGIAVRWQEGVELGERLAHATATLLASPGDRALVIGADCPELGPATLAEAAARLADHDVVLVPAEDGGYVLIGLAAPAPALFAGVAWSTADVLEQTLARARAAGLRVALLDPLADLDTPDALVRWLARAMSAPPAMAPHTRGALVALGLLPG